MSRPMTLRTLMRRKEARAASVQTGVSCLMGKRLLCRWMLLKTKADRANCAKRQVAYGQPEVSRSDRKDSQDMVT
jgi:hypothetical protein